MKRSLVSCLLIILLALQASAQEQLSLKQQADQLYDRFEYFKSLRLYIKLADRAKPDVRVLERIADCFRNINRYEEAEAWYTKAVMDKNVSTLTHYNYAEVLLRDQKFDKAKEQYQLYFAKVKDPDALSLKLRNCDSASAWMKQPVSYLLKNADNINTAFSEWGATFEGKTGMLFTSNRSSYYSGTDDRTGNNWFKLYRANATGAGATEVSIINASGQYINSYHIGPIALNEKADTAYITITTEVPAKDIVLDINNKANAQKTYTRRLQLITAIKRNNQWIVISGFPYNDINRYSIGHAALSKNGQLIYFTSDMPGGEGKTDIWYCEKQKNGSWGKPVNCGKVINTREEEAFPEIGSDDVLYYSSKGLPGMGGFDIYSAKGDRTIWSDPVNLKYPINSTSDDFCLITRDGLSGYLSSNRQLGKGDDDIYSFTYKKPEPIPAKPPVVAISPKNTPQPVSAQTMSTPQVIQPQSLPQPVPGKEVFEVNNIYYDLDKSNIRPDAAIELDKLVAILKRHPTFKVSISSHTDSRAPGGYNYALSQRRSASVVAYLVRKGISPQRMTTYAYGKTKLLIDCPDGVSCPEEDHQLNRRTEFVIIPQ